MIASFSHNFIFLKTRKVGGTSLEIVLSSWCSGRDICSRVSPKDEELRLRFGGAQRNFRGPDGEIRFYHHMPAAEVRAELPELWRDAFTFTVDRHPYEKVLSRAWWQVGRRQGNPETELALEIDRAIEAGEYLNHPLYMIDGRVAVDELWKYEEMWTRVRTLADRLGVPMPAELPQAKAQHRKDRRSATEVLTAAQRERIFRDARVEFELLGYEP